MEIKPWMCMGKRKRKLKEVGMRKTVGREKPKRMLKQPGVE